MRQTIENKALVINIHRE